MTPTQIARRSDALYADGTRGMTRRVLCDMVAQRESDLEDTRTEFDKLLKEIEAAKHDLSLFSGELVASKLENAKLREQLDYMTPIALYAASERERDRMRELGVEVD